MIRKLADTLSLTTAERRVLQFLVVAFVAGLGIKLARDLVASPTNFDYSASDSTFAALSAAGAPETTAEAKAPVPRGPVRVNTASKDELLTLPGVGDVMAERIILERQENGPFTSVDDLKRVRGIGPKRIEQLRPLVIID